MSLARFSAKSIAEFGARTALKTLLEVPWFARFNVLERYVDWQPLPWALMGIGWRAAVMRRRRDLTVLGLALEPVAVYRNAFPYFYVVMLAPLVILAGYAVQEASFVARHSRIAYADVLAVVIWSGLMH